MRVPALVLVARSMREDARGVAQHLARLLVAGLLLLVLWLFAETASLRGAPGREFFIAVLWIDAVAVLVIGLGHCSAAIAEEKEAGTIGLLRMAGLGAPSILLGKLAGRLWAGLLLLAAQVPFVVLAVTLGGVSLTQVLAGFASLGALYLQIGTLALLCSVVARDRHRAGGLCLLLFLGLQLGMWLAVGAGFLLADHDLRPAIEPWIETTAWHRLDEIMALGFTGPVLLDAQVVASLVLGAACFAASGALFERCARDGEPDTGDRGDAGGLVSGLRPLAPPRAWRRAVCWKDLHFTLGGRIAFVAKGALLAGIFALFVAIEHREWGRFSWGDVGTATAGAGLAVLVVECGWLLARVFGVERAAGTWSGLLLAVPGTAALGYQKVAAVLLALVPSSLLVVLGIVLMPAHARGDLVAVGEEEWWLGVAAIVLFWHLCAWFALVLRRGGVGPAIGSMMLLFFVCSVLFDLVIPGRDDPWALGMAIVAFMACLKIHEHCGKMIERQGWREG